MQQLTPNWIILLPFLGGIAVTTQAAVNGQLREQVQSPLVAAFISFGVGTLVLGLLILLTKQQLPTYQQLVGISPHKLMGGVLGAFFVTSIILSVQRLSVANIFALVVAGQLGIALLYDHFGMIGVRQSPVTLTRLAGLAFLILGAYLINKK
ncbi:DMT family transporter [Pontibacter oryzae]|uniref:DMT family transporter n=1 Tax=Pontibacter oryzae TaxID=2304593 RepID=A0A399RXF9_9BACT|nr:DMT family transporter [Pontibacter oryzae]RIJ34477.1 DMT family transporter [Pontibacter oryzae]